MSSIVFHRDNRQRAPKPVPEWLLFDECDRAFIESVTWRRGTYGYATTSCYVEGRRSTIQLHRWILGLLPGDPRQADHINGNTSDNRRCNLRIVSASGNAYNRRAYGKSPYRGVAWFGRDGKWKAEIHHRHLGMFHSEIEAAKAAHDARAAITGYVHRDRYCEIAGCKI